MNEKGPESSKTSSNGKQQSHRVLQQTKKQVAKKLDCTILASCGFNGLPSCISWIEYPVHEKHLSIFIGITERELLNEPIYITKVDNGGMVQSQIQLRKNPSGSYNVNLAQCQYSRGGLYSMMRILDNPQKYNISMDCQNYLSLVEFFNSIDIDEGIITGTASFTYRGQGPSEDYT